MTGKIFSQAALLAAFALAAGPAAAYPGSTSPTGELSQSIFEVISAEIAAHRQQPEYAVKLLNRTTDRTKNPDVAKMAWHAAVQTQQQDEILRTARVWNRLDPSAEIPQRTVLSDLAERGSEIDLIAAISKMYAAASDKPEWTAGLTAFFGQSRLVSPKIETALTPYWEKAPEHARLQLAIALFKKAQNDHANACRVAQKALSLSPDSSQIVSAAADVCWAADRAATDRMLESFLAKHADDSVRLIHARVLARSAKPEAAMAEVEKALQGSPDRPAAFLNAGQIAADCRQFETAERYLLRYIELIDEQNPEADLSDNDIWLRLASILHENGRHEDEADALSNLTSGNLAPEARLREAGALSEAHRLSDARAILHQAATDFPEHAATYASAEARLLSDAGDLKDALSVLQNARQKAPNDLSLAYDAAMLAQNLGEDETAELLLKGILKENPDHVQSANALGYLYALRGVKLEEARKLLEHAYRLAPLDPYILDSMGWLCFKEGRYDQAAEFTFTSLKKQFDVEVACHLVEILFSGNRPVEARRVFDDLRNRAGHDKRVGELGQRLNLLQ